VPPKSEFGAPKSFAALKVLTENLADHVQIEFHSRHMPRCFLLFANLLIDWRREMERIVEKTGTQASAIYHAA
jgi:hypothetical protein